MCDSMVVEGMEGERMGQKNDDRAACWGRMIDAKSPNILGLLLHKTNPIHSTFLEIS